MVLEMLMQSIFEVADVIFVGRLGPDALAAVGISGTLVILIFAVGIGFSMGATALVARRIGEKNPEAAAQAAVHVIVLTILLSIPFSIVGVAYAPELLRLMGASESVVSVGSGYCALMFGGNATIMLLFVINAVFRGAGDPSVAMWSLFVANALNIVLDPLLIFGIGPFPELGIEGAAIATIIGRSLGILFQIFSLSRSRNHMSIKRSSFSYDPAIVRSLASVSIPGIIQFLVSTASWIIVVRIVTLFGDVAAAGYTVGVRIIIFTLLPSWGLANAAATLVGQNLGAGKPDRAEKSVYICARYNTGFLFGITVLLMLFAPSLIGIATKDPDVIREGVACLRIIAIGYVPEGLGMVMMQSFNGAGDTRTPTLINALALWVFQLPAAWFLGVQFGLDTSGVYLGAAMAQFVLAALSFWFFRRGSWKTLKLSGS
ncbi:MAG: MATE family efflux transporter [Rhodothermales bacterium]|nr:MATE family efflux transporter [Rhodothermales bacterium]